MRENESFSILVEKLKSQEKEQGQYIINIPLQIPDSQRTSFQHTFSYIKKKLQIKNARKSYIDSILKKCKVKFLNAVCDCFQKCINIEIKKLPRKFKTNITISYNKFFINKKLFDIYKYFNLINEDYENFIDQNYIIKDRKDLFKKLCTSTIYELYSMYLESSKYKKEINFLRVQEGEKFTCLYKFASDNFIQYYKNNKPNKKRKKNNLIQFHVQNNDKKSMIISKESEIKIGNNIINKGKINELV